MPRGWCIAHSAVYNLPKPLYNSNMNTPNHQGHLGVIETAARQQLVDVVRCIPQLPQRQDSTSDQLRDLRAVANRLGMYDAADLIRGILERSER